MATPSEEKKEKNEDGCSSPPGAPSVTGSKEQCDSCDTDAASAASHPNASNMSKNQLKKLLKRQKWLAGKPDKRKEEKARRKLKRREAIQRGDEVGPSRKQLKTNTMATSSCNIRAVIDCSFDHLMNEKDVTQMVHQIQHSYSANRRAKDPMELYVTSVGGQCHDRLNVLGVYNNWDVHFKKESYEELFEKSSIVYLSSDSENILETLEEDKVYIIGGLVDHNHHKGLCHSLAVEKGLTHAQLPIANYMDMKTRKVLTVNQVFEILLRYTETNDWEKAFFMAIPKRKGAVAKLGDQDRKPPTAKAKDEGEAATTKSKATTATKPACVKPIVDHETTTDNKSKNNDIPRADEATVSDCDKDVSPEHCNSDTKTDQSLSQDS